mgnify:CR=1 FL=1
MVLAGTLPCVPRQAAGGGGDAGEDAGLSSGELAKKAVADAHECVKLSPAFSKGFYRLGSAYLVLGKTYEAVTAAATLSRAVGLRSSLGEVYV